MKKCIKREFVVILTHFSSLITKGSTSHHQNLYMFCYQHQYAPLISPVPIHRFKSYSRCIIGIFGGISITFFISSGITLIFIHKCHYLLCNISFVPISFHFWLNFDSNQYLQRLTGIFNCYQSSHRFILLLLIIFYSHAIHTFPQLCLLFPLPLIVGSNPCKTQLMQQIACKFGTKPLLDPIANPNHSRPPRNWRSDLFFWP